MMGVAYINSETANETKYLKSRYFVVIELIIIPAPNANPAINNNKNGVNSAYELG